MFLSIREINATSLNIKAENWSQDTPEIARYLACHSFDREGLQMTHKSRRTVLKGLAVTMPAVWATPMVESIILPAHAQGSPCGELRCPEPTDDDIAILCECQISSGNDEEYNDCLNANCLYGPLDSAACKKIAFLCAADGP
jgi:hypothetical protein